jgi:hypothetical protein
MAHENESTAALIRSLLLDTRDLIREELALARAEVRNEVLQLRASVVAFGAAAFTALLGVTLLAIAIGSAIAYWLHWPAWAGYGIVAVLLLVGAFLMMTLGRRELAKIRALPKTRDTIKENVAWIQSKSGPK